MCCFVILLLSNEMQMSVRRFSAIPHLRGVMEVESGTERFRVPKTSSQENVLVNDPVPAKLSIRTSGL